MIAIRLWPVNHVPLSLGRKRLSFVRQTVFLSTFALKRDQREKLGKNERRKRREK